MKLKSLISDILYVSRKNFLIKNLLKIFTPKIYNIFFVQNTSTFPRLFSSSFYFCCLGKDILVRLYFSLPTKKKFKKFLKLNISCTTVWDITFNSILFYNITSEAYINDHINV